MRKHVRCATAWIFGRTPPSVLFYDAVEAAPRPAYRPRVVLPAAALITLATSMSSFRQAHSTTCRLYVERTGRKPDSWFAAES